jgi:nicotinamide mononucleotide transporter PnuC
MLGIRRHIVRPQEDVSGRMSFFFLLLICFFQEVSMKNPFGTLSRLEWALWIGSILLVSGSFLVSAGDPLTLIASLIGVTSLIFIAKGMVVGQLLTVAFSLFYGILSFFFRYYGEMITYLGMTAPMAVLAVVSWMKHTPAQNEAVTVRRVTRKEMGCLLLLTAAVTILFYFILGALGNANLPVSTFSIATSFLAGALTYLRSPYYAVAYAANDLVLIVLWLMAAAADLSCLPMAACFLAFFVQDSYGFVCWTRRQKHQADNPQTQKD